jgi:hypothetical protein
MALSNNLIKNKVCRQAYYIHNHERIPNPSTREEADS